ncbi:phosphoribosylformylglycinamidine cyclo-ligase [bacterium]|nr:phosphoribosylformylglycinamidine cyclo-ligase [bacterium]
MKKIQSYRQAGVDIEAAGRFVDLIKPMVKTTWRPEVQADIGGFASLVGINTLKYKNPLLVSGTDGVGTKLKIAFAADRHDTVGIDLVAMCVNDVICCGAEPLFFLDYFATGRLDPEKAAAVVSGIVEGCKQAGCALVGGETAEMPDFYANGEYDLAGFSVGVVDRDDVIDGSQVHENDVVIGFASSGLHSNGYSLVRKIVFDQLGLALDATPDGFRGTVADELLTPTRIYAKTVQALAREFPIHAIAHITGGGLTENLPRVLPERARAVIDPNSWPEPGVFGFLRDAAEIADDEMRKTFNCGIGLCVVCPESEAENVLIRASGFGEQGYVIGRIRPREAGAPALTYETP